MTIGELIQNLEQSALQIQDTLYIDEAQLYLYFNSALSYLVASHQWVWNVVRDDITLGTAGKTFTLTYNFRIPYFVLIDNSEPKRMNLNLVDQTAYNYYYVNNKTLKTSLDATTLIAIYGRGYEVYDANDSDVEIPFPFEFVHAIKLLIQWMTFMNGYEQGANLANNAKKDYDIYITEMKKVYGFVFNAEGVKLSNIHSGKYY